ncbi:MAG: hypothetical protein HC806_09765 [Anaerolineae bacterium]|nr:hypothetical protein [Anaerolineae bacterium]
MFTEGYAASGGDSQLRRDVAEEATRLITVLLRTSLTPKQHIGELYALLALMLFQFSRFDARTTEIGIPIRLQEQDRTKWDQPMIQAGMAALAASRVSQSPSVFHLEARIAAEHATSTSFTETNWQTILALYDQLLLLKNTPEVRVNRVVAIRYAVGWETALSELNALESEEKRFHKGSVARSFLLHAIRADLLESAGQPEAASDEWKKRAKKLLLPQTVHLLKRD